jgi:hypothetical protein
MRGAILSLMGFMAAAGNLSLDLGAMPQNNVVHGTDRFEFFYRAVLPERAGAGGLWVPIARSDAFQSVEAWTLSESPGGPLALEDRKLGNKILFWPLKSGAGGETVKIQYLVERKEKSAYRNSEPDPGIHLKPERLVPVNETFRSIAQETAQGKSTDLERGRALYDHVLARMRYDKSGEGWGRGDAVYACDALTGNCTDFHAYFIALCRSLGIPARFAIGFTIPSDRDEGLVSGYHCWAEFYAEGKWIPVDISEAAQHPDLAEYYFGHHPANRFEISSGRDLVVTPGPALGPLNFLVYPYVEVAGKVVPVETEFRFRRLQKEN